MNLVILYYPPEVDVPQARLSVLACSLAGRGLRVTVVTTMPNHPYGEIHPDFGRCLRREKWNGIDIIRTFIHATLRADLSRRLTNYLPFGLSPTAFGSALLSRHDFLLVERAPLSIEEESGVVC